MHVLYTSIFEWLEEAKPYLNDIGCYSSHCTRRADLSKI